MASVLRFDDWETTLGTGVVSTDGSGNVAVGGSSPSYKLDVTGDINATGDLRIGGTAIGEWTTYSPSCTWSGAGSFAFIKYATFNNAVIFKFKFDLTGAPTGDFQFDLPFADTDGFGGAMGTAVMFDANGTDYYGTFFSSSDKIKITALNAGTVDATTPFTWANGDAIRGILTVEKS